MSLSFKLYLNFIILILTGSVLASDVKLTPRSPVVVNQVQIRPERTNTQLIEAARVRELMGGDREGNGGHGVKVEIVRLISDLAITLSDTRNSDTNLRQYAIGIRDIIGTTEILCSQNLVLRGQEVLAINYPKSGSIIFDCGKWKKLNFLNKLQLVTHEFLFMIGVDDTRYQFSSKMATEYHRFSMKSLAASEAVVKASMRCDLEMFNDNIAFADTSITIRGLSRNALAFSLMIGCKEIAGQLVDLMAPYEDKSNVLSLATLYLMAFGELKKQGNRQFRGNMTNLDYLIFIGTTIGLRRLSTDQLLINTCHAFTDLDYYPRRLVNNLSSARCGHIDIMSLNFRLRSFNYFFKNNKFDINSFRELFENDLNKFN
jgi:hypothetical protein